MYCIITNSNFNDIDSPLDDDTACCCDCDSCFRFHSLQLSFLDSILPDIDLL